MTRPGLDHEKALGGIVAGIDEAGRGPWAGPVVAAAVILDVNNIPAGINDSKKLSRVQRERLYIDIQQSSCVALGVASVEEIDRLNILAASMLAMKRACESLDRAPDAALIDGNRLPALSCTMRALVKGDAISLSIAAASIIAKVTRDRMMVSLAQQFPSYGWERNAGYGTRAHQEGLRLAGPCEHHRTSFAPIRAYLEPERAAG